MPAFLRWLDLTHEMFHVIIHVVDHDRSIFHWYVAILSLSSNFFGVYCAVFWVGSLRKILENVLFACERTLIELLSFAELFIVPLIHLAASRSFFMINFDIWKSIILLNLIVLAPNGRINHTGVWNTGALTIFNFGRHFATIAVHNPIIIDRSIANGAIIWLLVNTSLIINSGEKSSYPSTMLCGHLHLSQESNLAVRLQFLVLLVLQVIYVKLNSRQITLKIWDLWFYGAQIRLVVIWEVLTYIGGLVVLSDVTLKVKTVHAGVNMATNILLCLSSSNLTLKYCVIYRLWTL